MTNDELVETLIENVKWEASRFDVYLEGPEGARRALRSIRRRSGLVILSSLTSQEIADLGLDE